MGARHHPHHMHDPCSGSQDHHPSKNLVPKTICCNLTSNAPDDGRMYRNMLSEEYINKITLLHQVGIPYYFMRKMHGQTILKYTNRVWTETAQDKEWIWKLKSVSVLHVWVCEEFLLFNTSASVCHNFLSELYGRRNTNKLPQLSHCMMDYKLWLKTLSTSYMLLNVPVKKEGTLIVIIQFILHNKVVLIN